MLSLNSCRCPFRLMLRFFLGKWICLQILLAYGIPKETVAAITILYRSTKVKVISPDGDTEYFDIVAGVLQGDTLALYLFIICLDYVLRTSRTRLFSWAVWHSCRMGARNQEQTRGRIGPQLRLGNLRVGELHFCPLCTALDQASSLSRKQAYVPGPTFGFVKPLASSGSHCTKWADEQHWQAGFESRLLPDLPLPFIPTLIGLRAFDLVSSRVWWEAATNTTYLEHRLTKSERTASS